MQLGSAADRPFLLPAAATAALFVAVVAFHASAWRFAGPPYVMVDELVNDLDAYEGKEVRVHGFVMPGTIKRHDGWYLFDLERRGGWLRVFHRAPMPDTLRDGIEVLVTGQLVRGWYLDSRAVVAKCPTKYEGTQTPRTVFM
jgi:cytochrome c-type biogenesis protein CcmE